MGVAVLAGQEGDVAPHQGQGQRLGHRARGTDQRDAATDQGQREQATQEAAAGRDGLVVAHRRNGAGNGAGLRVRGVQGRCHSWGSRGLGVGAEVGRGGSRLGADLVGRGGSTAPGRANTLRRRRRAARRAPVVPARSPRAV